jgi:hypothetical protein
MLIKLSIITSNILNQEISQSYNVMWKSGHSVQWNSETPDDVPLGPKHVVKGRCDRNSCIVDGIILCIIYINETGYLNTILYLIILSWDITASNFLQYFIQYSSLKVKTIFR